MFSFRTQHMLIIDTQEFQSNIWNIHYVIAREGRKWSQSKAKTSTCTEKCQLKRKEQSYVNLSQSNMIFLNIYDKKNHEVVSGFFLTFFSATMYSPFPNKQENDEMIKAIPDIKIIIKIDKSKYSIIRSKLSFYWL